MWICVAVSPVRMVVHVKTCVPIIPVIVRRAMRVLIAVNVSHVEISLQFLLQYNTIKLYCPSIGNIFGLLYFVKTLCIDVIQPPSTRNKMVIKQSKRTDLCARHTGLANEHPPFDL